MTHAIIVPDAIKDAANFAASQIGVDPEGLLTTLSVPLVPITGPDDAEPTHFACCGQISDSARSWLEANQSLFPGAFWWRWDHENRLVASFDDSDLGKFWDWDNCLSTVGLKRRVVPLLGTTPPN